MLVFRAARDPAEHHYIHPLAENDTLKKAAHPPSRVTHRTTLLRMNEQEVGVAGPPAQPEKMCVIGKGGLDFVIAFKPREHGFLAYLPARNALFCYGCLRSFASLTQLAHYNHACLRVYRETYEGTADRPRRHLGRADLHTDDQKAGLFRGVFPKAVVDGCGRKGSAVYAAGGVVLDPQATLQEHRRAAALLGVPVAVWEDSNALACATCGYTCTTGHDTHAKRNMANHHLSNKGCVGTKQLQRSVADGRGLYRTSRYHLVWVGERTESARRGGLKRSREQVNAHHLDYPLALQRVNDLSDLIEARTVGESVAADARAAAQLDSRALAPPHVHAQNFMRFVQKRHPNLLGCAEDVLDSLADIRLCGDLARDVAWCTRDWFTAFLQWASNLAALNTPDVSSTVNRVNIGFDAETIVANAVKTPHRIWEKVAGATQKQYAHYGHTFLVHYIRTRGASVLPTLMTVDTQPKRLSVIVELFGPDLVGLNAGPDGQDTLNNLVTRYMDALMVKPRPAGYEGDAVYFALNTPGYMEFACSAILYSIRATIGAYLQLTRAVTIPSLASSLVVSRLSCYKQSYRVHHELSHKHFATVSWDVSEEGTYRGVLLQVGVVHRPVNASLITTWALTSLRDVSIGIDDIVNLVAATMPFPPRQDKLTALLAAVKPLPPNKRDALMMPFSAAGDGAPFSLLFPPLHALLAESDGVYDSLLAALRTAWGQSPALRAKMKDTWTSLLLSMALLSPNPRPVEYSFLSRENQQEFARLDPRLRAMVITLPILKPTTVDKNHVCRALDYETGTHLTVWCFLFNAPSNELCKDWGYTEALTRACSAHAGFSLTWQQMRVALPALMDMHKVIPSIARADAASSTTGPWTNVANWVHKGTSGHGASVHLASYTPSDVVNIDDDGLGASLQLFIQPLWRRVAGAHSLEFCSDRLTLVDGCVERPAGWVGEVLGRSDLIEIVRAFMVNNLGHLPEACSGFLEAVKGDNLHIFLLPCGSGKVTPTHPHTLTYTLMYTYTRVLTYECTPTDVHNCCFARLVPARVGTGITKPPCCPYNLRSHDIYSILRVRGSHHP